MRQDLEKSGHRFSQSGTLTQSGNSHGRFIRTTESAHYLWGFKGSQISRTRFPLCVPVHLGLYSPHKPIKVIATHSGHRVKKKKKSLIPGCQSPQGCHSLLIMAPGRSITARKEFFSTRCHLVVKGQQYNFREIGTDIPAQSLRLQASLLTSQIRFLHPAEGRNSF